MFCCKSFFTARSKKKEKNNFEFDDICDELCKKLIVRHPHVFGELTVSDSGEVLKTGIT